MPAPKMNNALRGAVLVALGRQPRPCFDAAKAVCSRAKCDRIAEWRVGARTWAHKTEHLEDNYISLQFPLIVCDSCKAKVVLADIIDNRGWGKIARLLRAQGFANPDRTSLQMEFEPLLTGTA